MRLLRLLQLCASIPIALCALSTAVLGRILLGVVALLGELLALVLIGADEAHRLARRAHAHG